MRSEWPLIGRADEFAGITKKLVHSGDYAGVVIAGDAGVGKSRLAREMLSAIAKRADVRWVVATRSSRAVPLGAFAEWIGDSGSDPISLVRNVIDSLTESPRGRPVVVGVDDAHLLDELSAFVVHQLAHRRLAKVIATVRNRETTPDAVTALWKDEHLDRLQLQPLSRAESDQLLGHVLGTLNPDAALRIWQLTRGNVLFLRHLVEQELAAHRLHEDAGMWTLTGEPVASTTLGDLIDAQMGSLSAQVRDVVDLLAVAEPMEGEVLAGMVGWAALDEAIGKGLVVERRSGQRSAVWLAHPLYGEVRRSRASSARLRRLRGRVVQVLAKNRIVDPRDLIQRAVLLLDSDLPHDAKLFTKAAGAAFQLLDPVLAERLADAARQLDGTYEATVLHSFALHLVGRVAESERVIAEAPDGRFTTEQRSNLATFRAGNLFWGLGLTNRTMQVLDEAVARGASNAGGAVQGFRAIVEAANGSSSAAVDAANAVLASGPTDLGAMAAYFALMLALGHAGRMDEAGDVAKRCYLLAERSSDAAPIVFGFTQQYLLALYLAGHIAEAQVVTERWAHQTAEIPVAFGAYGALFMGQTELSAGNVGAAREWLEMALRTFERFQELKFGLINCRSELAVALASSGEYAKSATELQALEAEANPFGFMESRCLLAAAWVSAAEGMVTEAINRARHAAAAARRRGHFGQEVAALHTATRFGDPTGAGRLAELCAVVDGPRVTAATAYAAGLALDDPDGLLTASLQSEDMGDQLAALDAAAHALSAYRRRKQRGQAAIALDRLQRLTEKCGGADTPALREALDARSLTSRQREIIALAEQGLSNKQIAERLGVSTRTVEGHRYRAGTGAVRTN